MEQLGDGIIHLGIRAWKANCRGSREGLRRGSGMVQEKCTTILQSLSGFTYTQRINVNLMRMRTAVLSFRRLYLISLIRVYIPL